MEQRFDWIPTRELQKLSAIAIASQMCYMFDIGK